MTPFFRGWVLGTGLGGTVAVWVGILVLAPRVGWPTWVWGGLAFVYGLALGWGLMLWRTRITVKAPLGWVCHPVSTEKTEGTLTVWPEGKGQWYALGLERGLAQDDETNNPYDLPPAYEMEDYVDPDD